MRSDFIGIPFKAVWIWIVNGVHGIFPLSILLLGAVYVEGGSNRKILEGEKTFIWVYFTCRNFDSVWLTVGKELKITRWTTHRNFVWFVPNTRISSSEWKQLEDPSAKDKYRVVLHVNWIQKIYGARMIRPLGSFWCQDFPPSI